MEQRPSVSVRNGTFQVVTPASPGTWHRMTQRIDYLCGFSLILG